MKELIILRAVPGAGKTTFASIFPNAVVCCADDWFYETYGEYKWSYEDAGKAHLYCQNKAKNAMADETDIVIIANTNTTQKEVKPYEKLAKDFGYRVHYTVLENRHGGTNEHNVPEESLQKMEDRLRNTLKLR